MKNIFLTAGVLISLFAAITGCVKEENKVFLESTTKPILSATNVALSLSFANKDNPLTTVNWTNPNYRTNTGITSNTVVYLLEMDRLGNNFGTNKKTYRFEGDLSKAFTVGEFNDLLLNDLQLTPGVGTAVQARIFATLSGTGAKIMSNTIIFSCTPYAIPPKVTPPSSNQLFITGSATGGWMNGGDSPTSAVALSKKFTRVSATLYELASLSIVGGEEYLLIPAYGDWSNKYGYTGAGAANNPEQDDFRDGGNNFKAPASSGNYKITVDFQRGKYTFIRL